MMIIILIIEIEEPENPFEKPEKGDASDDEEREPWMDLAAQLPNRAGNEGSGSPSWLGGLDLIYSAVSWHAIYPASNLMYLTKDRGNPYKWH